jgi:hypothetical protein
VLSSIGALNGSAPGIRLDKHDRRYSFATRTLGGRGDVLRADYLDLNPLRGVPMKKTLLIAAALVLAGCGGEKKAAPAAEGGMAADSSAMNMSKDTTMAAPMSSDTTMARDTTKK